MLVDTAVWIGFVFGFLTAWKILPFVGRLLHRRPACDIETWRCRHRRCKFCLHVEKNWDDWYCNVKQSHVFGFLPRFFCPLFEQPKSNLNHRPKPDFEE